ncbi:MAG: PEP-CTERM sorting domain-containing protein [Planctomycetota bacterium]|nr:PEP-CTERM sorting domain-containing protein [Planctomycetota bacterium]
MAKRAHRVCTFLAAILGFLAVTSAAWAAPYAGMISAAAVDIPGFLSPAAPAKETANLQLTCPSRTEDRPSLSISAADADTLRLPTNRVMYALGTSDAEMKPVTPMGSAFPAVKGLVGSDQDERAVPLGSTSMMGLNPGGFGRVMSGRPLGKMDTWSAAAETSISYVRPHINAQMVVALEFPGTHRPADFEGLGIQPRAYLDIEHFSRVDAADIGSNSDRFGRRQAPPPNNEPETAVAVGLDLGILPTFLSQMGVSVSLVATHGQETGETRVALVGTTELPVDWRPHERPVQHPTGFARDPIESYESHVDQNYGSGGVPSSNNPIGAGGGGGGGGGPIPITPTPPVPEPATLTLLGSALVAALAGRRLRGK